MIVEDFFNLINFYYLFFVYFSDKSFLDTPSSAGQINTQVVIIMAMIGYLSAVIRAPLTSTFVILEMTHLNGVVF
jgi:H+/Cl- antiporter ClcA